MSDRGHDISVALIDHVSVQSIHFDRSVWALTALVRLVQTVDGTDVSLEIVFSGKRDRTDWAAVWSFS